MDTIARSGAGLLQEIQIGAFALRSDEPAELGGTDLGPTPYGLLCAALAACTSMTLRLYAKQKGWPLDEVQVTVRHEKIYAKDCAECETKEGRLTGCSGRSRSPARWTRRSGSGCSPSPTAVRCTAR